MATIAWWWSIPVGATLIAILWAAWASRPKPPADTHDSLQSYQRFRAAMEHDTFHAKDEPAGSEHPRTAERPEHPERPE